MFQSSHHAVLHYILSPPWIAAELILPYILHCCRPGDVHLALYDARLVAGVGLDSADSRQRCCSDCTLMLVICPTDLCILIGSTILVPLRGA